MSNVSLLELSGVYHINERILSKLLRNHGIQNMSPAQTRILMALWEEDDVPVRKLAQITSLDKSTLSLSLARMEKNGMLVRGGDPVDKRVVRVRLTEPGKSSKAECIRAMGELTEMLFREVDPEQLSVFKAVLKQIFHNLSSQEQVFVIPD